MTAPPTDVVDLSMNEVAFGPLPSVRRVVVEGAGRLNRYPDQFARAVTGAIAEWVGVSGARVVVGGGSALLCQQLVQVVGAGRPDVLHPALSFEGYPLIAANAGARPVPVPMAGDGPDLDAMAAAVDERTRCVLLCNPNNPTGSALRTAELVEFLDRVPAEVTVVLDEAYREFVTDPDVPDGVRLADGRDNVCVLRTFSKAYGLATLRIGYLVAPEPIAAAARMAALLGFPGGLAQAAAIASLAGPAQDELIRLCSELTARRERLRETLLAAGLPVSPSQANFLWLPLGDGAEAFAERCRAGGVLVRPYPGHGVRITVGSEADNERIGVACGC